LKTTTVTICKRENYVVLIASSEQAIQLETPIPLGSYQTARGPVASHLGLYGSYRLIPGLTTLTCKCIEKDAELFQLKAKHEETIDALTRGNAETISHLTSEFQDRLHIQSSKHAKEGREVADLVYMELETRLGFAFQSLDSSWAKQKERITQDYNLLIQALRTENAHTQKLLEAEKTSLDAREKALSTKERDLKTSKKALTKNVQKRRAQLELSQHKLFKLQSVLSLVSDYEADFLHISQDQAAQFYEDAQEQAQVTLSLAQQEAEGIVEAAQARVEEMLKDARTAAESIIIDARRQAAALALEGGRRSPTGSDVSTSGYSLRSFESLPILEESQAEASQQHDANDTPLTLSRRASFDGTKKRLPRAMKRKPSKFSVVIGNFSIALFFL
jgi:hypothetical protein